MIYDNKTNFSRIEHTDHMIKNMIDSPLKQFKSRINAVDVHCKPDLLLVIKSKDNHPVCTTPLTALHLLEFGWGHIASPFETKTDLLDSRISGGEIVGYHYDLHSQSMLIKIKSSSNGSITVILPRSLIDAKVGNNDLHFFVLADGTEVSFTELQKTVKNRTLSIPFQKGVEKIEIIGTVQI